MADFYYSEKDILDKERETDAYFRIKSILASIKAAEVEQVCRWIPVKDRLPDLIPWSDGRGFSDEVIILTDKRRMMKAIWDGIDWIAPVDFWKTLGEKVTHWMPLPEPPKEEKHE